MKNSSKGDDSWSTQKTVLGWNIDTRTKTIHLPPRRKKRLQMAEAPWQNQKYVSGLAWKLWLFFLLTGSLKAKEMSCQHYPFGQRPAYGSLMAVRQSIQLTYSHRRDSANPSDLLWSSRCCKAGHGQGLVPSTD